MVSRYTRKKPTKKPVRKAKKASTALNKKEKTQTRKIAKQVLMSNAETKYFNTSRLSTLTRISTIASRSLASAIEVRAFAVGTGENPATGVGVANIDYGFIAGTGNPDAIPMNMTRAFGVGNGDLNLRL